MPAFFAFLLMVLAAGIPANAATPALDDFAYGFPLPLVKGEGLYAITLPLMVYEKVTQSDLGDLRVFNGAGETVPLAVRRPLVESRQNRQAVPYFPLPGRTQAPATDLSLRVSRNTDGSVITVDSGSSAAASPAPSSYLFDTTKLTPAPIELELRWDRAAGTVFTVSLSQSSDLIHWSPLVGRAVLADLDYNGSSVTVRRIVLPGKTLPYIRLDCSDCPQPLQLREVIAVSGSSASPDQWQWLQLQPKQSQNDNEALVFEYELAAKISVTALQLQFARNNSLARAAIESRSAAGDPWQHRGHGDFYRLNLQGVALNNPFLLCPSTADGLWRLRIVSDAAGLASGGDAPLLELGWREEQVVFLGRGPGPYTLAFGSARLEQAPPRGDNLVLAALQATRSESLVQRIEPGPVQTLAGEKVRQPQLLTVSWKKILLWAILLAGVALLAAMARTVYREMQAKKN